MVFNQFLRPQSSYERPAPLILVDPDADIDVSVCFNSAWMPYILGALQQLVLPTSWDTTDETELIEQIQRASLLIALFTTPCGEGMLDMFDVRQNEEMPCTLEKSSDAGETWEAWANLKLCPPSIRIDKGKLQYNNGSGWADVPDGGDERYDGSSEPQWTSPPSGQSGACLAAENLVASYVSMLSQTKAGIDAVLAVTGIVTAVSGYIGAQTLFPPALFILNISLAIDALALIGSTEIQNMIDGDEIDILKCIISCHAGADGAFTAAEFEQIKNDVDDQIGIEQKLIMLQWLNSYGPVGMTRAAASNGILEGDCEDCGCTWVTENLTVDITISDQVETAKHTQSGYDYKVTVSGTWSTADASDGWGDYAANISWAQLRIDGCAIGVTIDKGAGKVYFVPTTYSSSHIYEFTVAGNDEKWKFNFDDCYYPNNSGSMAIKIEQL